MSHQKHTIGDAIRGFDYFGFAVVLNAEKG